MPTLSLGSFLLTVGLATMSVGFALEWTQLAEPYRPYGWGVLTASLVSGVAVIAVLGNLTTITDIAMISLFCMEVLAIVVICLRVELHRRLVPTVQRFVALLRPLLR